MATADKGEPAKAVDIVEVGGKHKPIVATKTEEIPPSTIDTKTEAVTPHNDDSPLTSHPIEAKPSTDPETEQTTVPPPTPLAHLFKILPTIVAESDYHEMWGVELLHSNDIPTSIVLEKFLRANNQDVEKARQQLTKALKWRKEVQPVKVLAETKFDESKYGGLGFVTVYPKSEGHEKEIVTWNIYGAVKDKQATFGDVKEFIKWRSALMELSVQQLDLPSATVPIPKDGEDQYRMVQVHDYLNVSFLRMDPHVKAASKETIQVFALAYPELLKEKFFVNVPVLMGWMFSAMKLFLSPATVKKFHVLSYGNALAGELKNFGGELPTAYGGKAGDVKGGLSVKYGGVESVKEGKPTFIDAGVD